MPKSLRAAPWLLILLGSALRLRRFFTPRGVMHDEAQLAHNILTKSLPALLFKPLDIGTQAAPAGFLFLQKIATLLLGPGEHAIRIVPLLAGILSLPLLFHVAKKTAGHLAATLAVALLAFSEWPIYYAAEGKQYSTDLLWTLVILALVVRLRPRLAQTGRPLLLLAVTGAVLIWFSHPILFVLAAVGLALAWENIAAGRRREFLLIFAVGALWLASFILNYFLISRAYAHSTELTGYWADHAGFAPIHDLRWYPHALAAMFVNPLALFPPDKRFIWFALFPAVIFIAGIFWTARGHPRFFIIIVLAFSLCLAASGLHKYPFAERLLMFAVPLMILPIAAYLAASKSLPAPVRLAATLILLAYPLYLQAKYTIHPPVQYDAKPAMQYVHAHWQSGDALFLPWSSGVLGEYYLQTQPEFSLPNAMILREPDTAEADQNYAADLQPLAGRARVWIIFSMQERAERPRYEQILNSRGKLLEQHQFHGSVADLYDLN